MDSNVIASAQPHIGIFQDQWAAYQWALDSDAMGHQRIIQYAELFINRHYQSQTGHWLDLGCGNGFVAGSLIDGQRAKSYTAVDLCGHALEATRTKLEPIISDSRFIEADLFRLPEFVGSEVDGSELDGSEVDFILSSYAIHHGQREEKTALFQQLQTMISPGGLFLFADIMKNEHENWDDYCLRIENHINSWQGISENVTNIIMDHVRKYDFPESLNTYIQIADQTGWQLLELRQIEVSENYHAIMMLLKA